MKLKSFSISALLLLAFSGKGQAIECSMSSNASGHQTLPEGSEIDAAVNCSSLDAPDAQLFYGWAPPMPFHAQSGSISLPPVGVDIERPAGKGFHRLYYSRSRIKRRYSR